MSDRYEPVSLYLTDIDWLIGRVRMKLKVTEIPQNLKKMVPPGFRLEQRGAHEFLVIESIYCPHGHNLLVESVRIHGKPSVMLKARIGNDEGVIFVDAFWGSHAKLFSFVPTDFTADAIVEASCPVCGASLMERRPCDEEDCDSLDGIVLFLPGNANKVHVCARIGCPGHHIEIIDVPHEYVEMISDINYFGESADEMFGDLL